MKMKYECSVCASELEVWTTMCYPPKIRYVCTRCGAECDVSEEAKVMTVNMYTGEVYESHSSDEES